MKSPDLEFLVGMAIGFLTGAVFAAGVTIATFAVFA